MSEFESLEIHLDLVSRITVDDGASDAVRANASVHEVVFIANARV